MANLVVLDGRSSQFVVSKQAFGGRSHEVRSSVLRDARTAAGLGGDERGSARRTIHPGRPLVPGTCRQARPRPSPPVPPHTDPPPLPPPRPPPPAPRPVHHRP